MADYDLVGYFDITVSKGASYGTTFTVKVNGVAVPLTGYEALLQVRSTYDSDVLFEMSTENERITITENLAQVHLVLSKEETAALNFDNALYDLLLIAPSGEAFKYIEGNFRVFRSITQIGSS